MGKHKRQHKHGEILSLDRNYIPMSEISRRKAIIAVLSGRAQVMDLTTYSRFEGISAFNGHIHAIIYPQTTAVNEIKLSSGKGPKGVLKRDGYRCQYCGDFGDTVDHIIPRCQKGLTTWMNLACCCWSCNQKKRGRTPAEAGMALLRKPQSPRAILYERFYSLVREHPFQQIGHFEYSSVG